MGRRRRDTPPARAERTAAATHALAPGEESPVPASFTASVGTAAPVSSVPPELQDGVKIFVIGSCSRKSLRPFRFFDDVSGEIPGFLSYK